MTMTLTPMSGLDVSVSRLLAWCDLVTLDYTGVRLSQEAEAEARLCQWWTAGHGLCAVIARFRPDLLQYHSLGKTKYSNNHTIITRYLMFLDKSRATDNLKFALSVAEAHFNIPSPDKITSEDGELDQQEVIEYLAR